LCVGSFITPDFITCRLHFLHRIVDKALECGGDKEDCADKIIEYRNALYLVANMGHIQQGAIIEKLKELVGGK